MKRIATLSLAAVWLALAAPAGFAQTAASKPGADLLPPGAAALLGTDPLLEDTVGDGISDKARKGGLTMANPLPRGGKPNGLAIVSGKAEDNFDPVTKKDVADHVEMEVKNLSPDDIKGVDVFITLKDDVTGATENYYRKLSGFAIAKGASRALHFDIGGSIDFAVASDHFRANPNGAFYKTPNAKTVTIEIAAAGYEPASIEIKKNKGGAETAD